MRLIDADQLLQKLQKDPLFPLVEQYGISQVIKAAPTIETISTDECVKVVGGITAKLEEDIKDYYAPIRHGHWIHECNDNVCHLSYFYFCSVCNAEWNCIDNEMERFDYCPSCGAQMDEGDGK